MFVQPYPATGAVYQAPRQLVDFHPVWAAGGHELIFVAGAMASQMAAVSVATTSRLTFGAATRFPAAVTGDRISSQSRAYDILPDGRFVGIVPDTQNGARSNSEIRVVLNWPELVAPGSR